MQFFCVQITMCDHSWQSINVKAVPALPLREVLIPLTVPTKYQIHKHCQNCESPERQKIYLKQTVPTKYQIHKHRQLCESTERQKICLKKLSPKNVHSDLEEKINFALS